MAYSSQAFEPLTFFDARARFRNGRDTPRAYLERCLAVISDREAVVKAWVVLNPRRARGSGRVYGSLSPAPTDLVNRRSADAHQGLD